MASRGHENNKIQHWKCIRLLLLWKNQIMIFIRFLSKKKNRAFLIMGNNIKQTMYLMLFQMLTTQTP